MGPLSAMGSTPEERADECESAFVWLTELLALEIRSLSQVRSITS